jgi:hypothetical protein
VIYLAALSIGTFTGVFGSSFLWGMCSAGGVQKRRLLARVRPLDGFNQKA